jgi:amidohydrolase
MDTTFLTNFLLKAHQLFRTLHVHKSVCRNISIGLILILFFHSGNVLAQQESPFPSELQNLIESVENKVIEWRRDIHQHPELGNREFRTAALVADHLRSLGIEVQTEVAHTGVIGILRGAHPGPVVALRADMDALPVTERVDVPFASTARTMFNGQEVGVMHACGHDTHVAMLMGTAEVLAGYRENLHGTVKFIFQPAEEGPPEGEEGGAELMVKEGVLQNPDVDVVMGIHVRSTLEIGKIGYTPGGTMASADDFRIVVRGVQTHGAYPWEGADPIVASAHIITALQSIVSRRMALTKNPAVVTVGMVRGGVRSNIIPEEVEMLGTMRALHPDDRLAMIEHMHQIVENTARAMGVSATLTLPVTTSYPVTYNDIDLTNRMVPVLQSIAGADNIIMEKPVMGAEDFSYFAEKVPGLFIFLGGRPSDVPISEAAAHHTPDFFIDDSRLNLGVKAFVAMTLDYMNNR